jgi:hypothetical protein
MTYQGEARRVTPKRPVSPRRPAKAVRPILDDDDDCDQKLMGKVDVHDEELWTFAGKPMPIMYEDGGPRP